MNPKTVSGNGTFSELTKGSAVGMANWGGFGDNHFSNTNELNALKHLASRCLLSLTDLIQLFLVLYRHTGINNGMDKRRFCTSF